MESDPQIIYTPPWVPLEACARSNRYAMFQSNDDNDLNLIFINREIKILKKKLKKLNKSKHKNKRKKN